jgi:hypothetical protein
MKRIARLIRAGGVALLLLLTGGGTVPAESQTPQGAQVAVDEPRLKAAFVYNFLKFVEWPKGTFAGPRNPLVVAIIGDGPTANATASFLIAKQIASRPLVIRRLTLDDPLGGVHALFIGDNDRQAIRRLLDLAGREPILSVGDSERFAALGGTIGLVVEEQKVRFEVNLAAASHSRLKVSSKLLSLARTVHYEGGQVSQ